MSYLFKYYAGLYDSFMKRFKLDSNDAILKNLGDLKDKKVLDVGGGTGTLADLLQKAGAKVSLVDPSLQMTQIAKKKNPALQIYTSTLEEIDKKILAEQFDLVIIRDALHHMKSPEETIRLANMSLNKTGVLIISEFDWKSMKAKLIWCFETLCFERCRMFTEESLIQLCHPYFANEQMIRASGFEMIYKGEKIIHYEKYKTTD